MERDYQYIFEKKESVIFSVVDYVVFVVILFVLVFIGFYYVIKDRKMMDEKEFFLVGRFMQIFLVFLFLFFSFIFVIMLLGILVEVYINNMMYWWIFIGFILLVVGIVYIFVFVFY